MDKFRAWGFAVGVLIAWSLGFAVATNRLGEATRRHSSSAAAAHAASDLSRGRLVR